MIIWRKSRVVGKHSRALWVDNFFLNEYTCMISLGNYRSIFWALIWFWLMIWCQNLFEFDASIKCWSWFMDLSGLLIWYLSFDILYNFRVWDYSQITVSGWNPGWVRSIMVWILEFLEEFWIGLGIFKVWYFWRINKLESGHWIILWLGRWKVIFKDVGICREI